MSEALKQLEASGYIVCFEGNPVPDGDGWQDWVTDSSLVPRLYEDARFQYGGPMDAGFHTNLGPLWQLVSFRSVRGTFGKGSLQIVVNVHTRRGYYDVDRTSPLDDLYGAMVHLYDVVKHIWKQIW